ncbi:MAG: alpha-L-rhamnosidase C-terminal domain-containing protein, partial [Planctomycetota bacterium]
TYVYDAAREAGFGHAALDHLIRHWAPMIADGGTWETFNTPADPSESRSHAWSAHPIYHLPRLLGGIVQLDAAWEMVQIAPLVDAHQVRNVEATVPTPHGPLTVTWRREGRHAHVEADVPAGVPADVVLPKTEDYVSEGLHAWDVALSEDPVQRENEER